MLGEQAEEQHGVREGVTTEQEPKEQGDKWERPLSQMTLKNQWEVGRKWLFKNEDLSYILSTRKVVGARAKGIKVKHSRKDKIKLKPMIYSQNPILSEYFMLLSHCASCPQSWVSVLTAFSWKPKLGYWDNWILSVGWFKVKDIGAPH